MVGLSGLEPLTSPLSGVRSSQLSYRPMFKTKTGGAGRDRTGGLLNANQALSQLSYSPLLNESACRQADLFHYNRGRLDAATHDQHEQHEIDQNFRVEKPED